MDPVHDEKPAEEKDFLIAMATARGITPEQLDVMGEIADDSSRGWGHITTRQNIQFHFVELEKNPEVMRKLASVGLTTREACGDTVRNVMACHLAGACPYEHLDVTPWAVAAFEHFVRNPLGQRLPRKFKINFSGCETDCGQAMFNDVGVIAVHRPLRVLEYASLVLYDVEVANLQVAALNLGPRSRLAS